ncbi:MAG TPA: protein kinase [Planctomycetota bacterium]|nr:protein kinase [Planctomycetota bacterium]
MTAQQLRADDERFHGTVVGKELLDLVKMLHRICASGVLHLEADFNRASLCLDGGSIRAAFFNELSGSPALSRIILIGRAIFRFELATAHTVAGYARNILKDTGIILSTVEAMMEAAELAPAATVPIPVTRTIPAAIPVPTPTFSKSIPAAIPVPKVEPTPTATSVYTASDAAPASARDATESGYEGGASIIRVSSFLPPEPGAVLGKCELLSEIGRGASSIVYRALHRALGLEVVLKVLMQEHEDADSHRQLTINEARLLARLNHPNILRVFDFTDYGRWPHLVVELVDGQPLDRLIRDRRVLATDEALPLICQAAEALGYAHVTLGVVHCDLKPENILLTRDLQVKLADFGLAKSSLSAADDNRLFANGTVAGTPSYIAPEQVQGGRAACDHRSDIYSLGATLYHAVTGRTPFNDPDPVQLMVKRLSEAPIPPHLVNPKVERRVSQLIMSMMARDPANRMQTWDEVLELLGDLLETLAPSTDRYRGTTEGDGKVIRRRTSFWNYVPNRLFRRASTDAKDVG